MGGTDDLRHLGRQVEGSRMVLGGEDRRHTAVEGDISKEARSIGKCPRLGIEDELGG